MIVILLQMFLLGINLFFLFCLSLKLTDADKLEIIKDMVVKPSALH
jgi:hypothetical protein